MTPPQPPRANPHLSGHPEAERRLLEAVASERLAHAWLIAGPRGIGKATLAFRFARFLLAGGDGGLFGADGSLHVDPAHPVCQRIAAGGHGNLMAIERRVDPKNGRLRREITVDDVRGIRNFLAKTAAEGGWRVVIIDAADEMNRNAANAVLKMLEEPPRQTLMLLVCHAPGRLLPTILSRCRRLTLSPLDDGALGEVLDQACPDLGAAERAALLRLGEGSPGRALNLAADGGLVLFQEMLDLVASLPDLDAVALHRLADKLNGAGADSLYRTGVDLLCWWLARLINYGARGQAPAEVVTGEGALMRRLLDASDLEQWVEVWEKVTRLVSHGDEVDLDRRMVILNSFTGMAAALGR